MTSKLRLSDLFSGIGAFSLGLEASGLCETVDFCEIDPHAQAVLRRHWPHVPIHDDITTREFHEGEVEAICGGFPCQDVSCAGKRAGLSGARSGLYRELVRAIRVVRPELAFVENVAALLGDGMGTVLGDLAEIRDCIEWDSVPAAVVGAPHERDRVWIIAHAASTRSFPPAYQGIHNGKESSGAWDVEFERFPGSQYAPDANSQRCREKGEFRYRQVEMSTRRIAPALDSDAAGERCGQGWTRRPPDSFKRIRDEARRNAADPYGGRLAFRNGYTRKAWELLTSSEREALGEGSRSLWPDEPALQGVDDVTPHWVDRVRETGNTVVRLIPQLIGEAIMEARQCQ